MGIPDKIDKHHPVWEEEDCGESETPWENEIEWETTKEIQRVNAREVQKIMAENCQGEEILQLSSPPSISSRYRGLTGLLPSTSVITCRAQHRAEIIPGTENSTA